MPAGRPSAYDATYCEDVIEYGRAGKSRAWIASEIGVTRQTLHNWEADHPEFLDAMTRARDLAQRWWEDAGQDGLADKAFNGPVYAKSMAARFPEDWRDNSKIEHSGGTNNTVSLTGLTVEQLEAIAAAGVSTE
jgi:hypothetical protein